MLKTQQQLLFVKIHRLISILSERKTVLVMKIYLSLYEMYQTILPRH